MWQAKILNLVMYIHLNLNVFSIKDEVLILNS